LREVLPTLSNVGVLWNPEYSAFAADWRSLREAARQLKISVHSVEVRQASQFDMAFGALRRERVGAFLMFSDLIGWYHTKEIADAATRNRLPAIYAFREAVDGGGLMSYGPTIEDLVRRSSGYVNKILRGANPSDLPIEQPTKLELVINLKSARALGLTIPQSLLQRADQVIE
jgi:putative ABC transport system substrate-binding protein